MSFTFSFARLNAFRRQHEASFRAGGELNACLRRLCVDRGVLARPAHLPRNQVTARPLDLGNGAVEFLSLSLGRRRTLTPGGQGLHSG